MPAPADVQIFPAHLAETATILAAKRLSGERKYYRFTNSVK